MKDVTAFRLDILTFSEGLTQYFLSILAGYPNYAVNDPFKRKIEFVNKRLRQTLIMEDFEESHILLTLVNGLITYLENFEIIDTLLGDWLLQRYQIASEELWEQRRSKIHSGIFGEMVKKGVIYPHWLKDTEYQRYLLEADQTIDKILNTIETIEDQIQVFRKIGRDEAVIISSEWELKQIIKFLRWIVQQGIQQAFPEIVETMRTEKNPLGWIIEGFNQRIDDKMDEANASDPEEAIRILKSAFRMKPKPMQACTLYYSLAMRYEDLEKWEEAIEAYTKMLEVAPPNGVGLFNRAKIFHRLGKDAEAKQDLGEALSLPALHLYVLKDEEKKEAQFLLNEISLKK